MGDRGKMACLLATGSATGKLRPPPWFSRPQAVNVDKDSGLCRIFWDHRTPRGGDMDCTSAVSIALERAGVWARHFGADEVQPVHLLLGLLDEEEGKPAVLLSAGGIQIARIRETFAASAPTTDHASHPMSLAARTETILRHAAELGRLLSAENTIASDQVLLALLREEEDLRDRLEAFGLQLAFLERAVLGEPAPSLPLDEPLDLRESAEQVDTARILDAAANRAREGLRVLEDYCRFSLNDTFLSRELKELRHDLAEVLSLLSARSLLEARDTLGDVGTVITTASEQERPHLSAVVEANTKRLQEALRSLEEYGKLGSADFARSIEALRYRVYTLERALLLGCHARHRLADAVLCVLVAEASCKASLTGTISEAVAGGAEIVQLREKNLDDRTLLEKARQVRAVTRKAGALFIMNDRPDIARLAEADGVHLGQGDLPVHEARRILGPDALIGVSTHTIEQVRQAVLEGASYVGVGPTFASTTKEFASFPGLEFVHAATAETSLPALAIGGIAIDNLPDVMAAGARRVAVSGAICQADDPRRAAARLRQLLVGTR
jgi:thiamine-phosphate pyrophosphorylase